MRNSGKSWQMFFESDNMGYRGLYIPAACSWKMRLLIVGLAAGTIGWVAARPIGYQKFLA